MVTSSPAYVPPVAVATAWLMDPHVVAWLHAVPFPEVVTYKVAVGCADAGSDPAKIDTLAVLPNSRTVATAVPAPRLTRLLMD
jgi:hypothetical protein